MGDIRTIIYIQGKREDRAKFFNYINNHLDGIRFGTIDGIARRLDVPAAANLDGSNKGYIELLDINYGYDNGIEITAEQDYPLFYFWIALAYEFGCNVEYYVTDNFERRYFCSNGTKNRFSHIEYSEIYDDEVGDILTDTCELEEYDRFCKFKNDEEIEQHIRKNFKFSSYAEALNWFNNNMRKGGESVYFIKALEVLPIKSRYKVYGDTLYHIKRWLGILGETYDLTKLRKYIWNTKGEKIDALHQDLLLVRDPSEFKKFYLSFNF